MRVLILTCPKCNANLTVDPGHDRIFCNYCGCEILVDKVDKRVVVEKNITINKNVSVTNTNRKVDVAEVIKAKNAEKEIRSNNRAFVIALVFCLALMVAPAIVYKAIDYHGYIVDRNARLEGLTNIGDYSDYVGEDYEAVVAHFEAAGFHNIELIDLDDAGIFFWRNGKVEQVSIAGDVTFYSSDYFSPDSVVVITYH